MIAGGVGAAPVPSHANAARSARAKPQSHWGRTRARRTPGPGTPARAPATRGRTAGGSRATGSSRSPIGWGRCRSRGARATGSTGSRAARASRARSATPARSTRPGSGFRISDVSVPLLPYRSIIPVHIPFDPIFWSKMSMFGRWTQRLRLLDGQKRIDRFRGAEERSDGQGRTPPDAGQRPGRGRPGRLPAGKPSPRCMRRRRTGSRARCGRCSPMIGRTATTARVRRRSGRSDTKERRRAERLRKTRRRVMANRSDRDRPDPNPIAHEAQLGAAVFPGARASGPRGSWCAFAPTRAGSPRSRKVALSKSPWSRAWALYVVRIRNGYGWLRWWAQALGPSGCMAHLPRRIGGNVGGSKAPGNRQGGVGERRDGAWLPETARQDASAPIARPARCPSTTATSMSRGW